MSKLDSVYDLSDCRHRADNFAMFDRLPKPLREFLHENEDVVSVYTVDLYLRSCDGNVDQCMYELSRNFSPLIKNLNINFDKVDQHAYHYKKGMHPTKKPIKKLTGAIKSLIHF